MDSNYYIIHSHVLEVCLRKELVLGKQGGSLVKEFISKMKKSSKQRVVNEHQMINLTREQSSGLDLA